MVDSTPAAVTSKESSFTTNCPTGVDSDLHLLHTHIGIHPDFPIPGILFRDVLPLFANAHTQQVLMQKVLALINGLVKSNSASAAPSRLVLVGLEARGFLLAPLAATLYNQQTGTDQAVSMCVRKSGKLPGKCFTCSYQKEYGKDEFQIQAGLLQPSDTVIILDDLLATGGTAACSIQLIKQAEPQCTVLGVVTVVELLDLPGRKTITAQHPGVQVRSVLQYT